MNPVENTTVLFTDDEAYVRRLAKRHGYALRKSRARNLHMNDLGGYRLIDPWRNWIVLGERFDLDLEDVKAFLQSEGT